MKTTTKSALMFAAALIAMPVAQASAETIPGWYAGLGAGLNFERNGDAESTNGTKTFHYRDADLDLAGSAGYAWSNGLRVEGEAFHSNSVLKNGVDGSLDNTDLFVNALYDFNYLNWPVTPYVGVGVGVGFPGANNIGPTNTGGRMDDSDVQLAYQGIAGVSYAIDKQWAVTADYRYIATLDPKFGDSVSGDTKIENSSHNVLIGVRYSFGAPETPVAARSAEAPAMPQARTASRPAVAPIPQTFQVFFDYDKSDLTPEAKRIIASAAEEYKGGKFVRIVVTGHTDTKGTVKYNKHLSERRAAAVKAEFTSQGVEASAVVTKGVGKDGLLVPTNDQVREAQNRRAEIVLNK
jgi:outer membrane protein OmpA-like peptidoglycan-associated protein